MNPVFASIVGMTALVALVIAGGSRRHQADQQRRLAAWARAQGDSLEQTDVDRIAAAIVEAATRYDVPISVLASIAYHESRWTPTARNGTACGTFQQKTQYSARWSDRGYAGDAAAPVLTCDQLCNDIEQAARICARKIRAYSRESGSLRTALCMYARGATGGANCIDGGAYADSELDLAVEIDRAMRKA